MLAVLQSAVRHNHCSAKIMKKVYLTTVCFCLPLVCLAFGFELWIHRVPFPSAAFPCIAVYYWIGLAVVLVDLWHSKEPARVKVLWTVLNLPFGVVTLPIYWFLFVNKKVPNHASGQACMETTPQSVTVWCIIAAIAGLGCFVLPVYLIAGELQQRSYGQPLIPWFASAFANLHFAPSMLCFFLAGVALGSAQPRFWWLLAGMTLSLPFILNTINDVHDGILDPTSHNMLPFEWGMIAIVAFPAIPGAFLGSFIRTKYAKVA